MKKWIKKGLLFCTQNNRDWMQTHSSTPTVEVIDERNIRVYFSTRDSKNRSSVTSVDIADILGKCQISEPTEEPIITFGDPGYFDDSGVSVSCLIKKDNIRYLFYLGWNLAQTVPWRNSIGLAISEDNKPFKKFSKAPIMDRSNEDPFSISYSWVMPIHGIYKMWYGTNLSWGPKQEDMKHVIKTAHSIDLINWSRDNQTAINHERPDEYAISRPCIIYDNNVYKMWYSYRGEKYKIGYAESTDAQSWTRKDALAGISTSDSSWDSEMICYPYVFKYNNQWLMIYNGNGYGKSGFGLATLED